MRQEGGNKEIERYRFHKIGVEESSKAIGKKGPSAMFTLSSRGGAK